MPKPWAKTEIGYLSHPKFLALNANAICLWHEGKQYCDMHHTDGLIPEAALKTFRFAGRKSIVMLLTTCPTPKPDGTPYAPLWHEHSVGYKMHDYLDHNDCREEVLARLEDADEIHELRKEANRKRQAEYRAKRRSDLEALRNAGVTEQPRDSHSDITRTSRIPTETVPVTETVPEEEKKKTPPRALLDAWNATVTILPRCEAFTEDRIRAARSRLQHQSDLSWWASVVRRIEASDFLTGRVSNPKHPNWRADVDWFLRPGVADKVMEGKYDNRIPAPASGLTWAQRKARPTP